ncbi:curli minor subunit CsgB [Citrobacter freundii]|nr:curli minor subunit CsgB [Citrobacter freundii]
MKNKLLFMMFTMLGVPGIAAATTSYDLANSEYNFAVNELSKSSFNQAAIIGQVGTANSANTRQGARSYCQSFRKKVLVIERKQTRRDHITFAYIDQTGSSNDASIKQGSYGNTAVIIQKGSGNKANITQYGTQKTAVVVQRQSQMAIRVTQR